MNSENIIITKGVSLMQIAVAGTGYVGLSLSVLLAQHNQVTAVDVIKKSRTN